MKFLGWLGLNAVRLGCVRLAVFTAIAWPYLLVLQKRAAARPAASAERPNPFTYRLQ